MELDEPKMNYVYNEAYVYLKVTLKFLMNNLMKFHKSVLWNMYVYQKNIFDFNYKQNILIRKHKNQTVFLNYLFLYFKILKLIYYPLFACRDWTTL